MDEPTQWTSSTIERKRLHIPHTTYLHYVQETYDVISLFFLIQPAKMIQQSFSGRHHSPKMQNFVYVQWSGATPPLWKRAPLVLHVQRSALTLLQDRKTL